MAHRVAGSGSDRGQEVRPGGLSPADIRQPSGPSLMPFGNSDRVFVPEGHSENSPAFQRRVEPRIQTSPGGTAENPTLKPDLLSALRDSVVFEPHQPGVETPGYFHYVPPGQGTANSRKTLGLSLSCVHPLVKKRCAPAEPRQLLAPDGVYSWPTRCELRR